MADESKSRLTNVVGLITAVTGLIAALVALSGALKSHLAPEAGNNSAVAATAGNTAAPSASGPAPVSTQALARGPAAGGQVRAMINPAGQSVGAAPASAMGDVTTRTDRVTAAGALHAQPTETVHVEQPSHAPEPDPQDDSSTPEPE